MKIVKISASILLAYVGLVALAEGLIGYIQPDMPGSVRIITTDSENRTSDRVLAGFRFENKLYVGSNHWLRGWYNQALANPNVEVVVKEVRGAYRAVSVEGDEHDRLSEVYSMGFVLRMVCGFAPSRFIRLDPR